MVAIFPPFKLGEENFGFLAAATRGNTKISFVMKSWISNSHPQNIFIRILYLLATDSVVPYVKNDRRNSRGTLRTLLTFDIWFLTIDIWNMAFDIWHLTNGPMDQWTDTPMDQYSIGPMDQWTNGPMSQWTNGPIERVVLRQFFPKL